MVSSMERVICAKITDKKARARLQKSVERVIQKNQAVFDKLAKS